MKSLALMVVAAAAANFDDDGVAMLQSAKLSRVREERQGEEWLLGDAWESLKAAWGKVDSHEERKELLKEAVGKGLEIRQSVWDAVGITPPLQQASQLLQKLTQKDLSEDDVEVILDGIQEEIPVPSDLDEAPAPEEGLRIYIDGYKAPLVENIPVDSFTQEILYHFPIAEDRVNDTHVLFKFGGERIHGQFVKDIHVLNSYEYGTFEHDYALSSQGVGSVFDTDAIKIGYGIAEKFYTLHHDGAWPDTSLTATRNEQKERRATTNWLAEKMRLPRSVAVFLYSQNSQLGQQMMRGAMNSYHTDLLDTWVKQDGGKPNAYLYERLGLLMQNLTSKAASTPAHVPELVSSLECFHVNSHPDIWADMDHVSVPLNQKLQTFKGNTRFQPQRHMDYLSAVTILTHDANTNMVSMYVAGSTFFEMLDPFLPDPKPRYFWGPVDGQTPSLRTTKDARVGTKPEKPKLMYALHQLLQKLPIDYNHLYKPTEEICPQSRFDELAEKAREVDALQLKDDASALQKNFNLALHIVEVADCATDYITTPYDQGNGVDVFELIAWGHFIIETPAAVRLPTVNSWKRAKTLSNN